MALQPIGSSLPKPTASPREAGPLASYPARDGISSLSSFHVKHHVRDLVEGEAISGTDRVSRETVRRREASVFYASYSCLPLRARE